MARNADPPAVRQMLGTSRLYDLDELLTWWRQHTETAVREERMRSASKPTAQCNIRITADDYAFMKSIAKPGQTIGHVGRILLTEAIGARRAMAD